MTSPIFPQPAFPHFHGLAPDTKVPPELIGPRALPYSWSISNTASAVWDVQKEIDLAQIDHIQAVFIDNSGNTSPVTLQSSEIPGMKIICGHSSQGVFPFFGKTLGTLTLSTTNASATTVNLIFVNTPQPYAQWLCT